ncbi:hypothetical protein [Iningainema tapete]|uniref:Uncharacterized protein n=1 Tax=Iningainema tapete BLCC-T55 TaxID=2748662 RepID=A0A8J6XG29_9CYAN|nr:hypothetical protein [Iningainema tapete]MBD2773483.1 hypothetical protein [Iningainema tapete BLCC-T55]
MKLNQVNYGLKYSAFHLSEVHYPTQFSPEQGEGSFGVYAINLQFAVILFFSVDEPEALERFFELYEEYQN